MRTLAVARALLALGAMSVASGLALAQETPPPAPAAAAAPLRVAIVDWAKLSTDWTVEVAESEAFNAYFGEQNQVFQQITHYGYLFDAEMDDVLRIVRGTTTPTEPDGARLAEVEKLTTDREKEYSQLLEKDAAGGLTDQEKERLAALRDCSGRRRQQFTDLKQQMEQEARVKLSEMGARLRDTKLQVIRTVAQASGVSVVLSAEAIVWSGPDVADITTQVLEALNRDHPAPAGAPPAAEG